MSINAVDSTTTAALQAAVLKSQTPQTDATQQTTDPLAALATGATSSQPTQGTHAAHHGHGGGHHHASSSDDDSTSSTQSNLEQLAESLGLSPDDVLDVLGSGSNLGDMLGSSAGSPYAPSVDGGVAVDELA